MSQLTFILLGITIGCVLQMVIQRYWLKAYREWKAARDEKYATLEQLSWALRHPQFLVGFKHTGDHPTADFIKTEDTSFQTFESGDLKIILFQNYVRLDIADKKVFGVIYKDGTAIKYEFTKDKIVLAELLSYLIKIKGSVTQEGN